MTPREMQRKSVRSQAAKYGSPEAFRAEMRRRASLRKVVGNFRGKKAEG